MESIRNEDVIKTGYIPVEYNFYKELLRKAEEWDRYQFEKNLKKEKEENNEIANNIWNYYFERWC